MISGEGANQSGRRPCRVSTALHLRRFPPTATSLAGLLSLLAVGTGAAFGQSSQAIEIESTIAAPGISSSAQVVVSGGFFGVGDCNGDGKVTVDEIILLVNIALGGASLVDCISGDADGSGAIEVDEIIAAVNGALSGITATPMPPATPTRTPTRTATRTPSPTATATTPQALRIRGDCSNVGASGRQRCQAGSRVQVYLCNDPGRCAAESPPPSGSARQLSPLTGQNDTVRADGSFDFSVDFALREGEQATNPILMDVGDRVVDFGPGGVPGALVQGTVTTPELEVAIDPSSEATVRLLHRQGLGRFGRSTVESTFREARASTENLPRILAGAEEVETSVVYNGQVEGNRNIRVLVGLSQDNYLVSTYTLPQGCEEETGETPLISVNRGVVTRFPFSRSVEGRIDGRDPGTVQVLYLTNILNFSGGPRAIFCSQDRTDVVCDDILSTGPGFRDFDVFFVFPVVGTAEMVTLQQVRVDPIDPLSILDAPCVAPDCTEVLCHYNVRVR